MFQGRERGRVVGNFAVVTSWSPTLKWTLSFWPGVKLTVCPSHVLNRASARGRNPDENSDAASYNAANFRPA